MNILRYCTLILSAIVILPVTNVGDGLETALGLSPNMVSTNVVRSAGERIAAALPLDGNFQCTIAPTSAGYALMTASEVTRIFWTNSETSVSGSFVLQEFQTATNSWQWLVGMLNGSTMMSAQRVLHYTFSPDIPDICLCWHDSENEVSLASVSSVTLLRGNLVGVASGTHGSNLVHAATAIMDAITE